MRVGVTFPQSDLAMDAGATKEWAQTVEGLGFDHILLYDHVLGADRDARPGWDGFHGSEDRFHEVMVLLGFLSAVTDRVELATGILCLPQRQTVLVAKQAAEVDQLSGGRLLLGVGIGWNDVEYEALGMGFADRARRMEEQIVLLRQLWTEQHVTFDGEWHRVTAAGLTPPPVQRPIPIWIGSKADRTIDRVARLADGWMPEHRDPELIEPQLPILRAALLEHGRDPDTFGLHGRLSLKDGDSDYWSRIGKYWASVGASHFSISTIWSGETTLAGHLRLIEQYAQENDLT